MWKRPPHDVRAVPRARRPASRGRVVEIRRERAVAFEPPPERVGGDFVDPPAEEAEAGAVGRAPARDAVDHPTRADRVAVARLEVRTGNAPGHAVTQSCERVRAGRACTGTPEPAAAVAQPRRQG